ncbi:MAG: VOC family protein [Bacteroidales bacterium]|nr:VOC family protein [Bacteroidales bacterium]
MRVNALDHVNIRTRDVAGSAAFYVELLGLEARNGPGPFPADQVQWLCDHDGRAIIHLFRFDCEPGPTGPIHHVALNCTGKAELIGRLEARGTEFSVNELPAAGLTQVFIHDPHGILLELNFYDQSA